VPSAPIAARGQSWKSSTTGLCQPCLALAGTEDSRFGFTTTYGAIKTTLAALSEQPYHRSGCALCGHTPAIRAPRWRDRGDGAATDPVTLELCSVCSGLLELVDRPDRPRSWRLQHQDTCLTGMRARLMLTGDQRDEPAKSPARTRRPRLTDTHQDILAALEACGALRAVDLARDPQSLHHQDSSWWTVRLAHLLAHGLITYTGADPGYLDSAVLRLQDENERDLARACHELHRPGPAWNAGRVASAARPAHRTAPGPGREGPAAPGLRRTGTAAGVSRRAPPAQAHRDIPCHSSRAALRRALAMRVRQASTARQSPSAR
jgi:hypothetical protein